MRLESIQINPIRPEVLEGWNIMTGPVFWGRGYRIQDFIFKTVPAIWQILTPLQVPLNPALQCSHLDLIQIPVCIATLEELF